MEDEEKKGFDAMALTLGVSLVVSVGMFAALLWWVLCK
jgi:hypothetical protein